MSGPPPAITASTRRRDRNRVDRSGVDAGLANGTVPHPTYRAAPKWSDNRAHRCADSIGIRISETYQQRANTPRVVWPVESECLGYGEIIVGSLFGAQRCRKASATQEVPHNTPTPAVENQSMEHGTMGTSAKRSIMNFAASPP